MQVIISDHIFYIGMQSKMDLSALVFAATDISSRFCEVMQRPCEVVQRPEGPEGEDGADVKSELLNRGWNMLRALDMVAGGPDQDVQHWRQLQSLAWCPVLTDCPESLSLPWPRTPPGSHPPFLAPPRVVRPIEDQGLVSASLHLLDTSPPDGSKEGSFSPNFALQNLMSWNSPPRTAVLLAQLIQLGQIQSDAATLPSPPLFSSIHQLYSLLASALNGPEAELILMSLEREETKCIMVLSLSSLHPLIIVPYKDKISDHGCSPYLLI